jgi:hypothetical protein
VSLNFRFSAVLWRRLIHLRRFEKEEDQALSSEHCVSELRRNLWSPLWSRCRTKLGQEQPLIGWSSEFRSLSRPRIKGMRYKAGWTRKGNPSQYEEYSIPPFVVEWNNTDKNRVATKSSLMTNYWPKKTTKFVIFCTIWLQVFLENFPFSIVENWWFQVFFGYE